MRPRNQLRSPSLVDRAALPPLIGELERFPRLQSGVVTERCKELTSTLGIHPRRPVMAEVISAGLRRHPYLVQRLLKVDHDLAAVAESDGHHAPRTLAIQISVGGVVDTVAALFHRQQQLFCTVHEFEVGHYNLRMFRARQILVRTIVLAVSTAAFAACGQRGPLYLPTDPAAAQRATLPETLNPAASRAPASSPVDSASTTRP